MRHFAFAELTEDEFQEFSDAHPRSSFVQSAAMGRLRERLGWEVSRVGVREDGRLVAATLIAGRTARYRYFDIQSGPLVDFHDEELLTFFLHALSDYVRRHGGVYLTMNPNIVYQRRDAEGNPMGEADRASVEALKRLGLIHSGFTRGYGVLPRWLFVKDLGSMRYDEAFRTFDKRTQWSIKRTRAEGLRVRRLQRDELGIYKEILEETGQRRHFRDRSMAFYEAFYDCFGDSAEFLVAELHVEDYLDSLRQQRDAYDKRVEQLEAALAQTPGSRKRTNQLRETRENIAALQRRFDEAEPLRREGQPVVPVAASLFAWSAHEMVYLFSGTLERYKPFYGSFALQEHAMRLAIERGITRYDFYGIDGVFDDPDDPGRGVLMFKQGFGGYVEELVGEFTLPVRPLRFRIIQLARRMRRRL